MGGRPFALLRYPLFILSAAFLVLMVPFLNRALFVDDHAHYQGALEIIQHPATPYTINSEKLGWKPGESPAEANPPLYFYLVGALTKIIGDSPFHIHWLLLPLHFAGILAFYFFARKIVTQPLPATLLWMITPHLWLTSNSLLLDALLAPFLMVGLTLFSSGWDRKILYRLLLGSLVLGLVPLVKYTGVVALAVAFLWALLIGQKRKMGYWFSLLIPLCIFGCWILLSRHLYTSSHLSAVAQSSVVWPSLLQFLTLFAFSSGTTFILLLPLLLLVSGKIKEGRLLHLSLLVGGLGVGIFIFQDIPQGTRVGIIFGFWLGTALQWFNFISIKNQIQQDPIRIFLLVWIVLGLAGLLFARGWLCGRYFVIIGPAFVLLTFKTWEKKLSPLIYGFLFLFALCFAVSDYQQAGVDRRMASEINQLALDPQKRIHYPSAMLSGLEYYLDRAQWISTGPEAILQPGDWILIPTKGLPSRFIPKITNPTIVNKWTFHSWSPIKVLDSTSYAGYYGSIWGPLPFSFSNEPAEVYYLVENGNLDGGLGGTDADVVAKLPPRGHRFEEGFARR